MDVGWLGSSGRLLDRRTALVADLVYQQQDRRGHEPNGLDVGLNRIVGRSLTLSAGLEPGIAQDAAAVRVFAGIKWTIKDALPWQ